MTRCLAIFACFSALLLAGCLGGSEPVAPGAIADAPATEGGTGESVSLYSFDDVVVGADPSHPLEPHGPLVDGLPVARQDTFVLPEGAVDLTFEGGPQSGTGMGRIEVMAPDGRVVWASVDTISVGVPGAAGVGLMGTTQHRDDDALPPGEYRVLYRTGGAFQFTLSVEAVVPGAAPDGPD